jgi:bacteriocin resistance YdeI/OmpD-like protein/uncharacterized protein DUF1905
MAKKSKTSTFRFTSRLSSVKGSLIHSVVFLPKEIVDALPEGRVRTKGTLNGVPFALAPMYKKDGSRFFSVNAAIRKAARIKEGDKVEVIFKLVNPLKVDIPEELEAVLAQDDEAMKVWEEFTPGMQRSLILYITSVKNVDSRIKRALELVEKAKLGLLSSQKKPHP